MAIHFNTKPAKPVPPIKGDAGAAGNKSRTKTQQKKQQKIEDWYAGVRIENEKIREGFDAKHIPTTIQQGIASGRLSAQDIIEAWETQFGQTLGPRDRRYVVANTVARDYFKGKTPGANNYCEEVADFILERMLEGEPIRSICRDPHMPHLSKFLGWIEKNTSLRERYTLAKELRAEVWADDLISLGDSARMGVTITHRADGTVDIVTADMTNRTRMQIEVRKFLLSKILPKKYGTLVPEEVQENAGGVRRVVITGALPDEPLGDYDEQDADKLVADTAAEYQFVPATPGGNPKRIHIARADDAQDVAHTDIAPTPSIDPADYDTDVETDDGVSA